MYNPTSLLLILAFLCTACGGGDTGARLDDQEKAYETAAEQMNNFQKDHVERPIMETEEMKALAPDNMLGMPRTNRKANKVGAGGFTMATLTAEYQSEGDPRRITLNIMDGMGGNLPGMGMINSFTIDEEDGTKTTKSIKIDGHKAVRTFDTATGRGELTVLFPQSIVKLEGRKLRSVTDLEDAYYKLDLGKL